MKVSEMKADDVLFLYHQHIETIREQLKSLLKSHRKVGSLTDLLSDISYYSETLRPWAEGEDD